MTYIKPQEVRSPKKRWRLIRVLHDGGIGEWSVAEGQWSRGGRWRDVLAIRWNGDSSRRGIGSPQAHGRPTWFIVSDEMEAAMRSVIASVAEPMACTFSFFVSANWSKKERERSVHVADLHGRRIRHEGTCWTLKTLLDLARDQDGAVLVGVDAALGVPDSFWRKVPKTGGRPVSFIDWLRGLDPDSDFFAKTVRNAAEWRVYHPFFHITGGDGSMTAFNDLLPGGFLRKIDRRTHAKPIFAASGISGIAGSGTRALRRELAPLLREDRDFAVWPFEGDLSDLASRKKIVLAEIHPGIAHGTTLANPTGPVKVTKNKLEKRNEACDLLENVEWARDVDLGDLRFAREDKNAFDSLFMAAAVLRCTIEGKALFSSPWIDRQVEGGTLLVGPPVTGQAGKYQSEGLPGASNDAADFPPPQGGMAVPLEAPADRRERFEVPEKLAAFIRSKDLDTIGASEAAERLKVSRTTVYHWATRKKLLAWTSDKRGVTIPAEQILGPGSVVPGLPKVLDVIDDPELAWAFLTQNWPFSDVVARPLDKLACGQIDEVVDAAPGFGTIFT